MTPIRYRTVDVDSFKVFYREGGSAGAPKLLLLHGFPSAGHMFRDLIPLLADRFHIVAPDLPGFGQSDKPPREKFSYTFDNIARVIDRFTEVIGFDRRADGLPARRPSPRAYHRHHFAERQRLRRRSQRGLDSDQGLLARPVAGEPKGAPRLPHARDNALAVHAGRTRSDGRVA